MAKKTTKATNSKDSEHSKNKANEPLPETHRILIDDKASKLSPKNPGFVYFQLGECIDNSELELRITGNDSGGLYSKEWVKLSAILAVLDEQEEDKPFKSGVFKPVFKGGSANNVSFLSAVLRSESIALIDSTENSIFLHQLHGSFESGKEALLKLVNTK